MDLPMDDLIVVLAMVFFAGTLAFMIWNSHRR